MCRGGLRSGLRRRAVSRSRRTSSLTVMSGTGSQSNTPVIGTAPLMMSVRQTLGRRPVVSEGHGGEVSAG